MFSAVLLTIAKLWKQTKCPSIYEWIKLRYTHMIRTRTVEYCLCVQSLRRVWLFVTPWTRAHQAFPPIEFPRQEYWIRFPFPPPGDLPNSGTELASPALADGFFTTETPGKASGKLLSHKK